MGCRWCREKLKAVEPVKPVNRTVRRVQRSYLDQPHDRVSSDEAQLAQLLHPTTKTWINLIDLTKLRLNEALSRTSIRMLDSDPNRGITELAFQLAAVTALTILVSPARYTILTEEEVIKNTNTSPRLDILIEDKEAGSALVVELKYLRLPYLGIGYVSGRHNAANMAARIDDMTEAMIKENIHVTQHWLTQENKCKPVGTVAYEAEQQLAGYVTNIQHHAKLKHLRTLYTSVWIGLSRRVITYPIKGPFDTKVTTHSHHR